MNIKKIVSLLLLGIIGLGIALVGYQEFVTSPEQTLPPQAAVTPQLKNGVEIYYFHGNQRCTTCIRMEKSTQAAVMNHFFKDVCDGNMRLSLVNVDLAENEHYIDDYQLVFRTVVIVNFQDGVQTDWRRLDKIWELANNEAAFEQYVTDEIGAMLRLRHG